MRVWRMSQNDGCGGVLEENIQQSLKPAEQLESLRTSYFAG